MIPEDPSKVYPSKRQRKEKAKFQKEDTACATNEHQKKEVNRGSMKRRKERTEEHKRGKERGGKGGKGRGKEGKGERSK